jgi:solute carrier family 38 (sodium-coupled neutral amino acid transporter), member 11
MLGRGGRQNGRVNGDSQPLLSQSREDLTTTTTTEDDNVLFSIEDDDGLESSALVEDVRSHHHDDHPRNKADQAVRFQEEIQVIAPSLRSTSESREAGM